MSKNQKGFSPIIIILGFLIIVVIGGVFYIGRQNKPESKTQNPVVTSAPQSSPSTIPIATDESANWKTYTNTKYEYSIMYPQDWYILVSTSLSSEKYVEPTSAETGSILMTSQPPCPHCGGGGPTGISISTETNNDSLNSEQYAKQVDIPSYLKLIPKEETINLTSKPANLKAIDATIVTGFLGGAGGAPGPELIISKGKIIIIVSTNETDDKVTNQIFSSIKLLDQGQPSGTSDWKTYSNNKLNFSFKYPSEYIFEKEDINRATFSGTYGEDQKIPSELALNFKRTVDLQSLKNCNDVEFKDNVDKSCIDGDVGSKSFNGVKMSLFHIITGSKDTQSRSDYVVQTIIEPKIEFIRHVLGGGAEASMDKILSTFKFN